jgi:hypothetical protein
LRAEFTLATGLDAVKVAEPVVPGVKLNPVAEPRAVVPCATDCESEPESATDSESVKESALLLPPERAFPADEGELIAGALPGSLIAGALKAATVSATLVEAESASPGSATETDHESEPE